MAYERQKLAIREFEASSSASVVCCQKVRESPWSARGAAPLSHRVDRAGRQSTAVAGVCLVNSARWAPEARAHGRQGVRPGPTLALSGSRATGPGRPERESSRDRHRMASTVRAWGAPPTARVEPGPGGARAVTDYDRRDAVFTESIRFLALQEICYSGPARWYGSILRRFPHDGLPCTTGNKL